MDAMTATTAPRGPPAASRDRPTYPTQRDIGVFLTMYIDAMDRDDVLAWYEAQPDAEKLEAIRVDIFVGGPALAPVDPAALADVIVPGDTYDDAANGRHMAAEIVTDDDGAWGVLAVGNYGGAYITFCPARRFFPNAEIADVVADTTECRRITSPT